MSEDREYRLPPGRQWYDTLNGFRVGALTGGILGIVVAASWDAVGFWLVIVTVAVGGVAGFVWERRQLARAQREMDPGA